MILFMDGFDHYSTITQKWDSTSGNGAATITPSAARTGLNGLSLGGSSLGFNVMKNIPGTPSTIIMGFGLNVQSGATKTFWVANDGGGAQIGLQISSGSLQFLRGGGGGTAVGPASSLLVPSSTYVYVEVKVLISATVGTVECHVNGVAYIASTGSLNTKGSGTTTITQVELSGPSSTPWYFDDVYVFDTTGSFNNTFAGVSSVKTTLATANGTTNNWSIGGGSPAATNWQSINENPPDDGTTFVDSSTVGQIDRYTFPAITGSTVSAVAVNLRASIDVSGTRAIRAATKSGSTLGDNGSDFALGTSFTDYQGIFETDPNTSAAWTVAAVNAAEWGEKVTI